MPPFFRRLPFPSLRVRGFVAFVGALSLTACGAKLADPTAGCPTPAGEPTACASDASADGAKDGAFDASCPNPNPGRCAPTTVCTDGFVRTGGASCIDGGWVCEQRACAADAGLDSGVDSACSGTLIPLCSAGHKSALCCPPGAPCLSPEPFCDLGGDACSIGDCPDGGCTKGSISAADYDQHCVENIDCAQVYQGDACGNCFCPNATINQSARAQYQSDFAGLHPGVSVCSCPKIPPPICRSGGCAPK